MSKLEQLKTRDTDRAKINAWLKSIGAPQDEADEVISNCAADRECRAYYVMRHDTERAA